MEGFGHPSIIPSIVFFPFCILQDASAGVFDGVPLLSEAGFMGVSYSFPFLRLYNLNRYNIKCVIYRGVPFVKFFIDVIVLCLRVWLVPFSLLLSHLVRHAHIVSLIPYGWFPSVLHAYLLI